MLQISLDAKKIKHNISWYLDSGCSRHMTGKRSMFQDLVLKSAGEVNFGGYHKGKIIGSGAISMGNSPSKTNVLLVDGLAHNLLSISQLSDNGYDIIFNQKSCMAQSYLRAIERTTFITLIFQILKTSRLLVFFLLMKSSGFGTEDWVMLA